MAHRPFSELVKKMSPEAQAEARQRTVRILADMELSELRKELKVSQKALADKLKITQVAVSRLERRPDMHVSKLRKFIEAMGGVLEINAVFPNRKIRLNHLTDAPQHMKSR